MVNTRNQLRDGEYAQLRDGEYLTEGSRDG